MSIDMRPGAVVLARDGRVGTLEQVIGDERSGGEQLRIRTLDDDAIALPMGVVREVRGDGAIELACTRDEALDLGGREQQQPELTDETLDLHEEELVPHKEMREAGTVTLRTEIEEYAARIEVEALREEVEVEHVPGGEEVSEREEPFERDGAMFFPVYEEQLVVSRRLILKEYLKVRRVRRAERRVFEDRLQREHALVEHPENTPLLRESHEEPEKRPGFFGIGRS